VFSENSLELRFEDFESFGGFGGDFGDDFGDFEDEESFELLLERLSSGLNSIECIDLFLVSLGEL